MRIEFGVADELTTEIKISEGSLHGVISPRLYFYAADQLAFALAFSSSFDVSVEFTL